MGPKMQTRQNRAITAKTLSALVNASLCMSATNDIGTTESEKEGKSIC